MEIDKAVLCCHVLAEGLEDYHCYFTSRHMFRQMKYMTCIFQG